MLLYYALNQLLCLVYLLVQWWCLSLSRPINQGISCVQRIICTFLMLFYQSIYSILSFCRSSPNILLIGLLLSVFLSFFLFFVIFLNCSFSLHASSLFLFYSFFLLFSFLSLFFVFSICFAFCPFFVFLACLAFLLLSFFFPHCPISYSY